ncbi:DgyrCDS13094 [Dimorphilus gyrociliatus]|uniref:DgyrCDS13094 n=1 Tax=Dimorphilus gyrociliatus TaxID=2664684 RepID=A0A7I8W9Q3_9ANNE|nr:DgyrCDS13094 [Dimorphilus gyrociliatus]
MNSIIILLVSVANCELIWPKKDQVAIIDGDVAIGGLMMIHERDEHLICGQVMPQGGIQATEAMLYTIRWINDNKIIPGINLGARIKDDCDRDIYGLEQSVDFIRGK